MDWLDTLPVALAWAIYSPDSPYPMIMALVIGLETGSFLNVVIYRLPIMLERERQIRTARCAGIPVPCFPSFNPVYPSSRCPFCRHRITWWENLPVLSYCLLRGRCRRCGKRISIRYLVIEALTGILFVLAFLLQGITLATACTWGAIFIVIAMLGLKDALKPHHGAADNF